MRMGEIIRDSLAVLHGSREAEQRLLSALGSKDGSTVFVALEGLSAIKSSLAKTAVMDWLKGGESESMVRYAGHSYLSAVATANDLPALKAIAKALCPKLEGRGAANNMGAYRREDMESTIRAVLLRDVLSGSLAK